MAAGRRRHPLRRGGFEDIFEEMFGRFGGGAGRATAAAARPPAAAPTCAPQVEIGLEEAFAGAKKTDPGADQRRLRGLQRHRRRGRPTAAQTCPTCQGAGKVRAQQGFFLIERTCPTCGGAGRIIKNPCKVCQGAGRVQRDRNLCGQHPRRGRGRHPHPPDRRGRGRAARRARRRPLRRRRRSARTRSSSATAPTSSSACRCAMTQAALGGEVEVPVRRRRPRPGHHPGRHPGRRPVPPARQGLLGPAQRRARRHVRPGRGRDAAEPDQAAARAAGGIRGRGGEGRPSSPESEGFFAKVKEFWDGLAR